MLIAVIVHYWPSRRQTLPRIIETLKSGSLPPDRIIIWNNSARPIEETEDCSIINADRNYGPFARYAAALAATNLAGGKRFAIRETPIFVLMQDDDLVVGVDTVRQLAAACDSSSKLVGTAGRKLKRGSARPYFDGAKVVSGKADAVMVMLLCYPEVIANALAFAATMEMSVFREDDLLLSFSNLICGGINQVVAADYAKLPAGDEGLVRQPEHYPERDAFCQWFLKRGLI